jgi:hypothetical protein
VNFLEGLCRKNSTAKPSTGVDLDRERGAAVFKDDRDRSRESSRGDMRVAGRWGDMRVALTGGYGSECGHDLWRVCWFMWMMPWRVLCLPGR